MSYKKWMAKQKYVFLFVFLMLPGFCLFAQEASIQALFQAKNYQALIQQFGPKVANLERGSQYLVAQSHLKLKNSQAAIRVYELMLEKNPKDAPAWRQIAEVHRADRKFVDAISALKKSIEINPQYEAAYLEMAEVILEYKPRNRLEARMVYEDMVQKFGPKVEYQKNICDLAVKEGQHDIANKACSAVLQNSPEEPLALIAIGQMHRDKREFDKGDAYFNRMMAEHSQSHQVLFASGEYFKERRQFAKALEAFQKAAELDPKSYDYAIEAAKAACEVQNFTTCLKFLTQACGLDSKARVEVRRAATRVKASPNKEMQTQFEDLSYTCSN